MKVIEMYPFVSTDGGIDLYELSNAPKSNDTYLVEPFKGGKNNGVFRGVLGGGDEDD